jgi:acyl dehydratase
VTGKRTWHSTYEVTRAGIGAYCAAIGERDRLFVDVDAARAAGYDDLVAPPMFAAVFSLPAVQRMLADGRFDEDRAQMLHAAQTFEWTDLAVVAGDRITTAATVDAIDKRGAHRFFTFGTRSCREDGREVVRGDWLTVVRGG